MPPILVPSFFSIMNCLYSRGLLSKVFSISVLVLCIGEKYWPQKSGLFIHSVISGKSSFSTTRSLTFLPSRKLHHNVALSASVLIICGNLTCHIGAE